LFGIHKTRFQIMARDKSRWRYGNKVTGRHWPLVVSSLPWPRWSFGESSFWEDDPFCSGAWLWLLWVCWLPLWPLEAPTACREVWKISWQDWIVARQSYFKIITI
jgi:hypothetical protein